MSAITVVSYAVAAVAKLRNSGWDWVTGDTLRNHVARDNLEKALFGDPYSPLARVVLAHAWLFPPMAWATMVVELGAPLALVLRRWRVIWVAVAWVFHVGVLVLMAVFFPYQLSGVAYASLFPVERLPGWVAGHLTPRRARRDLRSPDSVAASGNN
jgi:hypothetical protein